jgi:hypothetical protein
MTKLEESLREVFRASQAQRRARGAGESKAQPYKRKDGTRAVGPRTYKITLFIQPWHFGDLMVAASRQRKPTSMTGMLKKLIEEGVPHVTARPRKTGTVTPITAGKRRHVQGQRTERVVAAAVVG